MQTKTNRPEDTVYIMHYAHLYRYLSHNYWPGSWTKYMYIDMHKYTCLYVLFVCLFGLHSGFNFGKNVGGGFAPLSPQKTILQITTNHLMLLLPDKQQYMLRIFCSCLLGNVRDDTGRSTTGLSLWSISTNKLHLVSAKEQQRVCLSCDPLRRI